MFGRRYSLAGLDCFKAHNKRSGFFWSKSSQICYNCRGGRERTVSEKNRYDTGGENSLRVVIQADLALLNAWANDPQVNSEYGSFGLIPADTIERSFAE